MKNREVLSTLFVGIDVSSKENVVCAIDFGEEQYLQAAFSNNQPGAIALADRLANIMKQHPEFTRLVIAMESTSCYSTHIATFLSSSDILMPYKPYVYCLNPNTVAQYRKSYVPVGKTDPICSFMIADFARVGRIKTEPWRGSQFLALQRLTRHRFHLAESIAREKTYMLTNIFLKFSELAVSTKESKPFSSNYGATATAVLTEFLSPGEIVSMSSSELIEFICKKSKNSFADPGKVADLLKKAAADSYKLDECLYEPLTISIASSFNCINAFESEAKKLNKAIEKTVRGFNTNEYQSLISIPGIGPVYAAAILAEIGSVKAFRSQDALAKYAGLVWNPNQSGDFKAEDTFMSKAGNRYLRYYLIEAANSVKNHSATYRDFYLKKYHEVKKHQHKRALALTSRKLIRLIFGLLDKNQLYSKSVEQKT